MQQPISREYHTILVWLNHDLRLRDNPALRAAAAAREGALLFYVLDDHGDGARPLGAASRWWLHNSLNALCAQTDGSLRVASGDTVAALTQAVRSTGARAVYWNRCYEPWFAARAQRVRRALAALGVTCRQFGGNLLRQPEESTRADGSRYRVFTPFYKRLYLDEPPAVCAAADTRRGLNLRSWSGQRRGRERGQGIDDLGLLPRHNWASGLCDTWIPGERGALRALADFKEHRLHKYASARDLPFAAATSRLSPHLRFGEISVHRVWREVARFGQEHRCEQRCAQYLRQIVWREFCHHLLHDNPTLARRNLRVNFDNFPWEHDEIMLRRWQAGQTGYPFVDAGMRQLWQSGYMHNRLRMVTGSFLVKNLLIDWRAGERWFFDTLVDADEANNAGGWQWVAGCGTDAAPYFRVFNPVLQGKKFDADGAYVRRFVPELAGLARQFVHCPWDAPSHMLADCGIELGVNYPLPAVDLATSRHRALAAFASIRGK